MHHADAEAGEAPLFEKKKLSISFSYQSTRGEMCAVCLPEPSATRTSGLLCLVMTGKALPYPDLNPPS